MQDGLVRAKKIASGFVASGDTAAPKLMRSYAIECQLNRMPVVTQGVSWSCLWCRACGRGHRL